MSNPMSSLESSLKSCENFNSLNEFWSQNRSLFNEVSDESLMDMDIQKKEYWRFMSLYFMRKQNHQFAVRASEIDYEMSRREEAKERSLRARYLDFSLSDDGEKVERYLSLIGGLSRVRHMSSDLMHILSPSFSMPELYDGNVERSVDERHNFFRWKHLMDRLLSANRIAIVGNGSSALGVENGEFIDAHDEVVRVNFPGASGYEKYVGG